jgi:hypothetical protein
MFQEEYYGAMNALNELQGHLESFIEGELNAIENSTNEEDYYYLDWGI